jgi:uncharacterized protein YjiS (DUF1127 family)
MSTAPLSVRTPIAPFADIRSRAARGVKVLLLALDRAHRAQAAEIHLHRLDAHLLRDIGLLEAEISKAVRKGRS